MIIGVTGTNGAGKGAVVDYLVAQGFAHYSVRDFLVREVKSLGLELSRVSMGNLGTELRHQHGPTFFSEMFMRSARERGHEKVLMESIRTIAEARSVQEAGGIILAIDAPLRLRYQRIVGRGTATDHVTFEEFRAQEDAEYRSKNPSDPALMNVLGVMDIADVVLMNDGSLARLRTKLDEVLAKYA